MISVLRIQQTVASAYGLEIDVLLGPDRHKSIAHARHLAMWLARERCGLSYPELGRAFGNRDHSTAMHAVRKVQRLLTTDAAYSRAVDGVLAMFPRPLITTRSQQLDGIEAAE